MTDPTAPILVGIDGTPESRQALAAAAGPATASTRRGVAEDSAREAVASVDAEAEIAVLGGVSSPLIGRACPLPIVPHGVPGRAGAPEPARTVAHA